MSNERILVIEDQEDNQTLIKAALGKTWRHSYAKNLCDARVLIENSNYDLILLDVMLDDGDGFQFFSELKTNLQMQCPVIFLTSKSWVLKWLLKALRLGSN